MKTLDQIAEAAGVTRAAIYKRFQSYGLSVTSLKGEKQGRATVYREDVERLIVLMFQPEASGYSSVDNNGNTNTAKSQETQGFSEGQTVTEVVTDTVDSSVDRTVTELREKVQELQGIVTNLEVDNKAAKAVTERAEAQAAAETARAERAEAQADALLQQVDKLTDAIRAAEAIQAAQAAQIARLPAPPAERQNRGGLFERLRNRLKGGKKEDES